MSEALENGELGLSGRWASSLEVSGVGALLEESVILLEQPGGGGQVAEGTEAKAPDGRPNLTLHLFHSRNLLEGTWSGWIPGAYQRRLVGSVGLMVAGRDHITGLVDYIHADAPMTAALRLTRTPLGNAPQEDPDPTPPEGMQLNT